MLLGEQLRRRHQRHLLAAADGTRGGQRRDHGFAAADVSLQQSQHGMRPDQIRVDLSTDALLGCGQLEGQRREQPVAQLARVIQGGDPDRRPCAVCAAAD